MCPRVHCLWALFSTRTNLGFAVLEAETAFQIYLGPQHNLACNAEACGNSSLDLCNWRFPSCWGWFKCSLHRQASVESGPVLLSALTGQHWVQCLTIVVFSLPQHPEMLSAPCCCCRWVKGGVCDSGLFFLSLQYLFQPYIVKTRYDEGLPDLGFLWRWFFFVDSC